MEEIVNVTFNKINGENFYFRVARVYLCVAALAAGMRPALIDPAANPPKHPPLTRAFTLQCSK